MHKKRQGSRCVYTYERDMTGAARFSGNAKGKRLPVCLHKRDSLYFLPICGARIFLPATKYFGFWQQRKCYARMGRRSGSKARACEGITRGTVAILVFIRVERFVISSKRSRCFALRETDCPIQSVCRRILGSVLWECQAKIAPDPEPQAAPSGRVS